jgi:hypothetical protein
MKPLVGFDMRFRHYSRRYTEQPGLPGGRPYMISEGVPCDRQQSKGVGVSLDRQGCCIALTPSVEGVACSTSASCRPLAWYGFAPGVQTHPREVLVNYDTHYHNHHNHLETHSLHFVLGEALGDILWEEARDPHLLDVVRTLLGRDGCLNLRVHLLPSFASDSCLFSTFDRPVVVHNPCPVFVCLAADTVVPIGRLEDSWEEYSSDFGGLFSLW